MLAARSRREIIATFIPSALEKHTIDVRPRHHDAKTKEERFRALLRKHADYEKMLMLNTMCREHLTDSLNILDGCLQASALYWVACGD
jgi:hypothetical protein